MRSWRSTSPCPSTEQLTVRLLQQVLEGLAHRAPREGHQGLPAARPPCVDQLFFPALRENIQDRLDEAVRGSGRRRRRKRNVAQVRNLLITLAVAQRIFPEQSHKALEEALHISHGPEGAGCEVDADATRSPLSKKAQPSSRSAGSARKANKDFDAAIKALLPHIRAAGRSRSAPKSTW